MTMQNAWRSSEKFLQVNSLEKVSSQKTTMDTKTKL